MELSSFGTQTYVVKNYCGRNSLPKFVVVDTDHDRLRYLRMTQNFFLDIQSRDLVST